MQRTSTEDVNNGRLQSTSTEHVYRARLQSTSTVPEDVHRGRPVVHRGYSQRTSTEDVIQKTSIQRTSTEDVCSGRLQRTPTEDVYRGRLQRTSTKDVYVQRDLLRIDSSESCNCEQLQTLMELRKVTACSAFVITLIGAQCSTGIDTTLTSNLSRMIRLHLSELYDRKSKRVPWCALARPAHHRPAHHRPPTTADVEARSIETLFGFRNNGKCEIMSGGLSIVTDEELFRRGSGGGTWKGPWFSVSCPEYSRTPFHRAAPELFPAPRLSGRRNGTGWIEIHYTGLITPDTWFYTGRSFLKVDMCSGIWCSHGVQNGAHVVLTWCSHGTHVVLTWCSDGALVVHKWCSHGTRV